MRINEVFYTVQGEGRSMGLPTVFVRTGGCNLRCTWCDTTYSFYEGAEESLDAVLAQVGKYPTKEVCLTGGEPLLQREAPAFVQALLDRGYRVTLETSGSLSIAPVTALQPRGNLVVSLDVKCPGSAMQDENDWSNLPLLQAHDQVKFVIADEADFRFACAALRERPTAAEVLFQACWQPGEGPAGGTSNLRWLAERVLREGLAVRVGTQLHKHIWGDERGR